MPANCPSDTRAANHPLNVRTSLLTDQARKYAFLRLDPEPHRIPVNESQAFAYCV